MEPRKQPRVIQLLPDYKSYYLEDFTLSDIAKKHNLSTERIRNIFMFIHYRFIYFLEDQEDKRLYNFMYSSAFRTKRHITDKPEILEELINVYDSFALQKVETHG
ncbi:MAG: hypothetical protein PF445_10460 [Melioribacteraceae bacterium]|jgi:predicted DNA-binding protein YlxM (UPF0122 family)|nr:hypothetical protein [Melioribacteraceae bacterium]